VPAALLRGRRPPGTPAFHEALRRRYIVDVASGILWFELTTLFVLLPLLLVAPLPAPVRAAGMVAALVYITVVSIRNRVVSRDLFRFGPDRSVAAGPEDPAPSAGPGRWPRILGRFALFVVASTAAVAVWSRESLFGVVRDAPLLWLTMLLVYCLFSVLPQVLVFRVFFFARYTRLFPSRGVAIVVAAVLFAWAHIVIAHPVVFLLTFGGGLIFSRTYLATRSVPIATIEHALYGFWLFTVGLGPIFAFPG
jgi:uncharacterized protein